MLKTKKILIVPFMMITTLCTSAANAQSLEQRATVGSKDKQQQCFIAQANKLGTRKLVRDCNVSCMDLDTRYELYESEKFPDEKEAKKNFLIETLETCETNYAAAMSSLSAADVAFISQKQEEARKYQEALRDGTLKKNKEPYLGRGHWHQQQKNKK